MPPTSKKPKAPPYTGPRYPIDEEHSAARTNSVAAANVADAHRLVTYRKPFDLSQPEELRQLTEELERVAAARDTPTDIVLPDGEGVFYLVYFEPADGTGRMPVLLPEGQAHLVLFGAGLLDSLDAALKLVYRKGILPLDDPGPS